MAAPISAISAYTAAAKLITEQGQAGAAAGAAAGEAAGGTSFTTLLKDAIASVNDLGHKSDTQTRALANGKSDMVNVVTAVSETEVAIDAVVAVRDKVIAAYEDIMKMPI